MPHCIIEYSKALEADVDPMMLVTEVHQAVFSSGLFEQANMKTRAKAFDYMQLSPGYDNFIHVTLRMYAGRSDSQKKQLSVSILQSLSRLKLPSVLITVEAVDMDAQSYAKFPI